MNVGLSLSVPNLMKWISNGSTAGLNFGFTHTWGKTSTVSHSLSVEKNSRARLMFRERRVRIKGTAKVRGHRIFGCRGGPMCFSEYETGYEVVSTVETRNGGADGDYYLEYQGTSRFKHPDFYNVDNKDVTYAFDAFPEFDVKSAHQCGERAIFHDKNLAVYRPEFMGCWLKDVQWGVGRTYGKFGNYVGRYNVPFYDKEDSYDWNVRQRWIRNSECEMMHTSDDGHHWCKTYVPMDDAVLMFRYNR